jgi:hypothetical protein
MYTFLAKIDKIGVNPFVFVPEKILNALFKEAGKHTGPIPIKGILNSKPYRQTLVRYSGYWRLYINTSMLKNSPKEVGKTITISIAFDPESRDIETPPVFLEALKKNAAARKVFDGLPASRKFEIVRYLARLKTKEALDKNCKRAIQFLLGNERFVGRDTP